jgi:hypothetical protein
MAYSTQPASKKKRNSAKNRNKRELREKNWARRTVDAAHPGLLGLLSYAEVIVAGPVHGCEWGSACGNAF